MKIYHYTTIETLALILESKSIKFSRLDMLDNKTESEPFSNFNPLNYIFQVVIHMMNLKISHYEKCMQM